MPEPGRYTLAPHQVPSPPQSDLWVDHLRWCLAVMDADDPDLPYVAGLLAYHFEHDGLTARQRKAAQAILNSQAVLWRNGALDCQKAVPAGAGRAGWPVVSREAMEWAKRQQIADPTLRLVLGVLAWRANPQGVCWPSQAVLAQECGLTDRSVRRSLALLERLAVIVRKPRSNGRAGRSSDLISLLMTSDFKLDRGQIGKARATSTTGHSVRLENGFQPDTASSATGHSVQGRNKEQTYQNLAKGKADGTGAVSLYGEGGETDDGGTLRGGLRVVAGAAPVGRTAGEGSR